MTTLKTKPCHSSATGKKSKKRIYKKRLFCSFGRTIVEQLKNLGKDRLAETYTSALNSFQNFLGEKKDVRLERMNTELMQKYEVYLKSNGLVPNTTSFYMRNLRAIYNRGVEKQLTKDHMPFKHVYTGIEKTKKRAATVQIIRQIRDLDLSSNTQLEQARDIFLFSFYTRGMSFIDMAYLKKSNLRNGTLTYRRQKTGQKLNIKWEKPMQDIVDKYRNPDSPFLLPIIHNKYKNKRKQYLTAIHLINMRLKRIGKLVNSPIALTTYVARHGWASIAKSQNIPISVISEAMGHDSESTTRIYLASLDTTIVDQANSTVIHSI